MFSTIYDQICQSIVGKFAHLTLEEALTCYQNVTSYDPTLARLFWAEGFGEGSPLDALLLRSAQRIKHNTSDGAVYAVVPIYATSVCIEKCLYCNYRLGNKGVALERLRLSDSDLIKEARYLVEEKGLRALELVYATDPLMRVDSMCRHVELLRELLEQHGGGIVGINAEALEEDEYRRLLDAGLSFAVLWQETYDRPRYIEVHPGTTKKSNFEYRLDAYERMISAGLKHIGMGVLSGLADWKKDWAMLMQHESYLHREYGIGTAILGIPRLKPAPGAVIQKTPFIPSVDEFRSTVALHNIFSPETMAFVNTREEWGLCVELSKGGGCMFTFNCSTIPGGYSLGHKGYQFPTGSYDAPLFATKLGEEGLHAVFDWTFDGLNRRSTSEQTCTILCSDNFLSTVLP
jgi:2-iminoacetate synthase